MHREPTTTKYEMHQGSPGTPVAVDERMNGFELRMGHGGLGQGGQRVFLAEGE